ncbi:hypothetical protein [Sphingobacterium hungaricum]|uniref:Uncharacterized protein n=1 Tax=Sphingobacterium hungaricum TaxID=2082723 RepID=A0A928UWU4_9SPHI|nr:hypothetical protein [Sphingobacterium hungaricum]MBE8712569.1 hypothetical protein [Sphingobacterium hungaricum]
MARVWSTSPLERKVLDIIKKHLESELKQYDGVIDGGIHLKYKPKDIRLKVIELNCIDYHKVNSLSDIKFFFVNINYQDEDHDLVEQVTGYIYRFLDQSIVRNLHFESKRTEICRISKYLWLGNNMFELTNNSIYKNKKHDDRIE